MAERKKAEQEDLEAQRRKDAEAQAAPAAAPEDTRHLSRRQRRPETGRVWVRDDADPKRLQAGVGGYSLAPHGPGPDTREVLLAPETDGGEPRPLPYEIAEALPKVHPDLYIAVKEKGHHE